MKLVTVAGTAAIFFFVATMMPVYAQHDGQGDKQGEKQGEKQGKPDRPQGRPDQGTPQQQHGPQAEQQQRQQGYKGQQQGHAQQPEPRPQQVQRREQSQPQQRAQQQQQRPPQHAREQRQPQRTQQQARAWQQQRGWLQGGGGWQGHDTWQQARAQRWSSDHRTWAQRGGYGGYYIPQDRFSLYFGNQHSFRLRTRPVMYMGYPRFEYSGFSFLLVDPWPEYWSENWYDSDDVYIDYDDGYYLYNRRYPQVRLAITIAL
jgi:hypothetical protein